MEKQHTEQSSLNAEKALYKKFFIVMVLSGGMIGGWVFTLVLYGSHWLATTQVSFSINGIMGDLFGFGVLGWLLGLPAAWLTARSVRKRRLRRNGKGCLKTAAWGAWWGAWATGLLMNLLFFKYLTSSEDGVPMDWAQPNWRSVGISLAVTMLVPALCGLVSAALLSLLLPKPETDSQTAFRQPEQET